MKSAIVFLVVLSTVYSASFGGEMTISPDKPKQGGKLNVSYRPSKNFSDKSTTRLVVYIFTERNVNPRAEQYEFSGSATEWKANLEVPSDAVYLMMKAADERESDDNGQKYWDKIIFDKSGKPLYYAHARAGTSYFGVLPEHCKRTMSFDKAASHFEQELQFHPKNKQAGIGKATIELDAKKITQEQFNVLARSVVDNGYSWNKEQEVRSAYRLLKSLGEKKTADSLAMEYSKQFPLTELAEEYAYDRLNSVTSAEELFDKLSEALLQYPHHKDFDRLAQLYPEFSAKNGKFEVAKEIVEQSPSAHPIMLAIMADAIFSSDSAMVDAAASLSEKAYVKIRDSYSKFRPPHYAPIEWKNTENKMRADIEAIASMMKKHQGKYEDALRGFVNAKTVYPEIANSPQFIENLSELYEKTGKKRQALQVIEDALSANAQSKELWDNHRKLYEELRRNNVPYGIVADSVKILAEKARKLSVLSEKMNAPAIEGTLKTIDGKELKLSDFKGKVVVLDFWATWCGPCRASFPALQKLYDKYKNDDKVAIVTVNCWERVPERMKSVQDFMQKNNIAFPVYFDLNDSVVKAFGVTGIPTKFYLSPDGKSQFKEVGFNGPERFLEEASEKIELLKQ